MKYFISVAAVIFAFFLILNPSAASGAVKSAVFDCLEVIVPSLFAFTALAIWLQKSGLYRVALKPLTFPLSKLLRMDEELCAVFVLSNIGGYPVGVKLLSELVNGGRLSKKDAGRMMCCCFGSGPSFVVGIAGVRVFGSTAAGLALFGACFLSSLMMAAAVRARGEIVLEKAESGYCLTSESFISSVTGSARVMFTVCAMIVGFAAATAALRELGVFALFERLFPSAEILPALLEVTRIKEIPPTPAAMPICAALLSFGGVCVGLQISALSGGIPLKGFMISRIPAAVLSALLAMPYSRVFADIREIPALAPEASAEPFSKNALLSACVLIMSGILRIEVRRARDKK